MLQLLQPGVLLGKDISPPLRNKDRGSGANTYREWSVRVAAHSRTCVHAAGGAMFASAPHRFVAWERPDWRGGGVPGEVPELRVFVSLEQP